MTTKAQQHVLICGAAGRDFHNFNVRFRDDPRSKVVAFTATQIPGIDGRRYPAQLAGEHYPHGIPIEDEARLEALVAELAVDRVVFAYSDVTHEHVMQIASRAMAAGADGVIASPREAALIRALPEAAGKLIVTPGVRPAGAALGEVPVVPDGAATGLDRGIARHDVSAQRGRNPGVPAVGGPPDSHVEAAVGVLVPAGDDGAPVHVDRGFVLRVSVIRTQTMLFERRSTTPARLMLERRIEQPGRAGAGRC